MKSPIVRRFVIVLMAALLLQGTVFALYYDDLLFLRQPVTKIVAGSSDTFIRHAHAALGRSRVTVAHLDTIASGAQAFGLHDVEVIALERRVAITAEDRSVRLRLADALRRAARFPEAEAIYLDLLAASGEAHR